MITEKQYKDALTAKESAQEIINRFHAEESDAFSARLASGIPFADSELVYSESTLCPCGHGLAYPTNCGSNHYWDCSAILKGIQDDKVKHTGKLQFAFYEVKSEGETYGSRQTTRGVFKPKAI